MQSRGRPNPKLSFFGTNYRDKCKSVRWNAKSHGDWIVIVQIEENSEHKNTSCGQQKGQINSNPPFEVDTCWKIEGRQDRHSKPHRELALYVQSQSLTSSDYCSQVFTLCVYCCSMLYLSSLGCMLGLTPSIHSYTHVLYGRNVQRVACTVLNK